MTLLLNFLRFVLGHPRWRVREWWSRRLGLLALLVAADPVMEVRLRAETAAGPVAAIWHRLTVDPDVRRAWRLDRRADPWAYWTLLTMTGVVSTVEQPNPQRLADARDEWILAWAGFTKEDDSGIDKPSDPASQRGCRVR